MLEYFWLHVIFWNYSLLNNKHTAGEKRHVLTAHKPSMSCCYLYCKSCLPCDAMATTKFMLITLAPT